MLRLASLKNYTPFSQGIARNQLDDGFAKVRPQPFTPSFVATHPTYSFRASSVTSSAAVDGR